MEFRDKMKLLLAEYDMSQKMFAEKAGMNYAHANKFFTGRTPNMDFLEKTLRVFPNVDLYWLLFSTEEVDEPTMVVEQGSKYTNPKVTNCINDIEEKLRDLKAMLSQS